MNNGAC